MASWYCKINDVEHGPISQEDLVKMAGEGRLAPTDMVRNEKKKKWYKAGDVKGLSFPAAEAEPERHLFAPRSKKKQVRVNTSAEATKLLKGLKKGGSDSNADQAEASTSTSKPAGEDNWNTARRSALTQPTERKPLDPALKLVLVAVAALVVLLVLIPPHKVPPGYKLQDGWHFSFIFNPPVAKVDSTKHSIGALNVTRMEDNIAYAPLSVNWAMLALECAAVIVIGGAAFGFLAARSAAAHLPDARPAHPPRRRAV